eukprot:TRINITY_DN61446_c0_g1_i1.p1 TRINITY_DN61446_c0_g1~~TRINITY_DN61446_c0_g1_i1.p1  ORF type:complete len:301 (+),score=71.51 TRINITY_DN61446_c0_g1_i1:214-1116(+)
MAVTAMPPIDLHTPRGSAASKQSSLGIGKGPGFQHLTFDSGRGERNTERERLQNKLIDVGQRFVGFDKVIEDDTMRRKMEEVKKFRNAHDGLATLEKALNNEIRKRVDTNKQIQEWTDRMANQMLENLSSKILVKIDRLTSSIETLVSRCEALEKGIAHFRGTLPSKLQVDTAALVKEISELRKNMETDRKQRVERDTAVLRRLAEMEAHEASQFNEGSVQLTDTYSKLKEEINFIARSDDTTDGKTDKFRAFILEEIASMKNTLAAAHQAREQTDDEIVAAMNQYTHALQKGLAKANGS